MEATVRDTLTAFGEASRARITVVPPPFRLIGSWDPRLLHRLIANLVGNALKYSPDGGPVEVVLGSPVAGYGRLAVSDHGVGLDPADLSRVFERFARSDQARSSGIPGMGLGLYACRGIVLAHGGTIELRSDGVGTGTTVIVDLPLMDTSSLED